MTTVEALADDLAVDPGDVRVILLQHDVHTDDLSDRSAREVREVLDPGGERTRHLAL